MSRDMRDEALGIIGDHLDPQRLGRLPQGLETNQQPRTSQTPE
jgi:hypothetical protein